MSVHPSRPARAKVTARATKLTSLATARRAPQSRRRAVTFSVALGLSALLSGLVMQAAAPSHAAAKKQSTVKKLNSADAQTAFEIVVRRTYVPHSHYYPTTWETPTTEHKEYRIVKLPPCRPTILDYGSPAFRCSVVSEDDFWWEPPLTERPPWDEQRVCTPQHHCCTVGSGTLTEQAPGSGGHTHFDSSSGIIVLHPHDRKHRVAVEYHFLDSSPARAGCREPSTQPPPYLQ